MNIKVLIPTHSSSLCNPPPLHEYSNQRKGGGADVGTDLKTHADTDGGSESESTSTSCMNLIQLQIYVHRERAMWNIFAPLFHHSYNLDEISENEEDENERERTSIAAGLALQILIHHFIKQQAPISCLLHDDYFIAKTLQEKRQHDAIKNDESDGNSNKHINVINEEPVTDIVTDTTKKRKELAWSELDFCIKKKKKKTKRACSSKDITETKLSKKNKKPTQIIIYILPPSSLSFTLPPNHCPSPNMYPEKLFTSLLVKLENMQIQLQSLNAYIATLGGGYFLCHYLSTAVCLARYQRNIALQLNDINLALKCSINEAYNYIHAGMIHNAFTLIQKTEDMLRERVRTRIYGSSHIRNSGNNGNDNLCDDDYEGEEGVILSMCKAAKWFAERVRDGMESKSQNKNRNLSSVKSGNTVTHDDFQRIRVVRNRSVSKNIKII
jgi:hypothetical protein